MKKFFMTIVVLAAALFLFTGCFKTPPKNTGDAQQNGTTETVVSNTVTAEEWDSAFDKSILSDIACNVIGLGAEDGRVELSISAKAENGAMLYHLKNTISYAGNTDENEEIWISDENGSVYYRKYAQGWIRNTAQTQFPAEDNFPFLHFKGHYSSFAYDAATDSYSSDDLSVVLNNQPITYSQVTVKFSDKRATFVKIFNEDEAIQTAEYTISYGNASVTLPADEDVTDAAATVSEDEWQTAFSSFFRNHTFTSAFFQNGQQVAYSTKNIAFDESRQAWLIDVVSSLDSETFYEVTPEISFIYLKTGENSWLKEIYTRGFNYDFCYYLLLADYYDLFRYDKEQKAFVAENAEISLNGNSSETFESIKVVFDNAKRPQSVSFSSGGFTVTETMSEYGTVTVTLPPEDEITANIAMSSAQWAAAFDESNFTDFTLSLTDETTSSVGSVTAQYSENAVMSSGAGKIIRSVTYIDGSRNSEKYYDYTVTPPEYYYVNAESNWESAEYDGENFSEYLLSQILVFKDLYDSFVYDPDAGTYLAENITLNRGGEVIAFDSAELEFSGGKLVYFRLSKVNGSQKNLIEAFIDYDKPNLKLPVTA